MCHAFDQEILGWSVGVIEDAKKKKNGEMFHRSDSNLKNKEDLLVITYKETF